MDYISTRDPQAQPASFTDILLGGLAPDGGLYLPAAYPQLSVDDLQHLRETLDTKGYAALAAEVLGYFIDDIPAEDIAGITARAYRTPTFSTDAIVPVSALEKNLFIAHLSEGPTAAFKDMAMQLLGELFEYELGRRGAQLNILGATSGDTGSSAEYAMRGREGIRVFMLTPAGRMTPFQQAQMFGLMDPNVFNIALDGVFDDCQDVVKAVSADADFKANYSIGAVNSINWARLMAQVVYYISSWIRVSAQVAAGHSGGETAASVNGAAAGAGHAEGTVADAQTVDPNTVAVSFCVPTGNFGDICAGHIARQMGVPIDKLIVATNENDVLDEFFRTGEYRVRTSEETLATSSPSMDISRASNFERFICDLLGRDAERTADLFGRHVKAGGFDLSADPAFATVTSEYGFLSGRSDHADRVETIRDVYRRLGVLLDPHTADGVKVARQWISGGERAEATGTVVETPIVCLETALPVKFADTIREATGEDPEIPARFADVMNGQRRVVDLPNDAEVVKKFIVDSIAAS